MSDDATDPTVLEHERALVASALQNVTVALDLLPLVRPEMFTDRRLARTWGALDRVLTMAREDPTSLIDAVAIELGGEGRDAPTLVDLHELSTKVPAADSGIYYAEQVRQAAARRQLNRLAAPELLPRNLDNPTEVADTARGMARKLQSIVELATTAEDRRRPPVPIAEVDANRPKRLLSAACRNGALLTVGNVLVLSGAGGIAKSPLSLSMALAMAYRGDTHYGPLQGGLFEGAGGPALIASYEDDPADVAYRVRQLAGEWWQAYSDEVIATLRDRLYVMGMTGRPLYGPDTSRGTLYASRPGPLEGWDDLWRGVKRTGARLVVIDPALCAYVGDANAAAPVREFLAALTTEAKEHACGILLIAHSTKSARSGDNKDPYDPGHVAGSSHWTDGARGVLVLDKEDKARGVRVLRIAKSNYGPSYLRCDLAAVTDRYGEICGFSNSGDWRAEWETNGSGSGSAETEDDEGWKEERGQI